MPCHHQKEISPPLLVFSTNKTKKALFFVGEKHQRRRKCPIEPEISEWEQMGLEINNEPTC
jgi:hypothetical protein